MSYGPPPEPSSHVYSIFSKVLATLKPLISLVTRAETRLNHPITTTLKRRSAIRADRFESRQPRKRATETRAPHTYHQKNDHRFVSKNQYQTLKNECFRYRRMRPLRQLHLCSPDLLIQMGSVYAYFFLKTLLATKKRGEKLFFYKKNRIFYQKRKKN